MRYDEQARLAMNSVTLQNLALPLRIASFEKDLFAGFSLVSIYKTLKLTAGGPR